MVCMAEPAAEVVELKPDLTQYRAWVSRPDPATLLLVAFIVVGAAVAVVVSGSPLAVLGLLAIVVLAVAGALGLVATSMLTSSIVLTPDAIVHRRWFVRRTELRVADGLRGLLADYAPPVTHQGTDLIVIQRADAKGPTIRLNGAFWRHDDLVLLARHAGIPLEAGRLRARHFEKRAPGIMRPWERHWIAFVTLGPLVVLAAIVATAFVAESRGWLPGPSVSDAVVQEQDDTRNQVMDAIDADWTTEEEVAACRDGGGSFRTASATGFVSTGSTALADPEATVAQVSDVLVGAGYTEVRPDVDGEELYLTARMPGDGGRRPEVTVSTSGGAVTVDVVSGCDGD